VYILPPVRYDLGLVNLKAMGTIGLLVVDLIVVDPLKKVCLALYEPTPALHDTQEPIACDVSPGILAKSVLTVRYAEELVYDPSDG